MFASADVDTTGVVKSVAGVKTRNPRFTVYFEKINQSFNNLNFFFVLKYIYIERDKLREDKYTHTYRLIGLKFVLKTVSKVSSTILFRVHIFALFG